MFVTEFLFGVLIWSWTRSTCLALQDTEEDAKAFMETVNNNLEEENYKKYTAMWSYQTNINEDTFAKQNDAQITYGKFEKDLWQDIKKFNSKKFKDPLLRRQFEERSILGFTALSDDQYNEFETLQTEMTEIYNTANICSYKDPSNCTLSVSTGLDDILTNSRDPDELKYYWVEQRKAVSAEIRPRYEKYVKLIQEAATANDLRNAVDLVMRIDKYGGEAFVTEVYNLWKQIEPHWHQLFSYMRKSLRKVYGEEIISKTGPIPAHLWANRGPDLYHPFTNVKLVDITAELKKQKYTPEKMARKAEEYYTSMGLPAMTDGFWKNSIFQQIEGKEMDCDGSAWDLGKKDYRIKMCAEVTKDDFDVIHHEIGRTEYAMAYAKQPFVLQDSPNEGFHEGCADGVTISLSTPKYLQKIGLITTPDTSEESELSFLLTSLLDKLPQLPFAMLQDQWRWDAFRGVTVPPKNYNCAWWNLKVRFQGLTPPVKQNEQSFDAGTQYHIVSGSMYIKYFVGIILQYQVYESLCVAAGQFDRANPQANPLHRCDSSGNIEAGKLLTSVMELGSSQSWQEVLKKLTGKETLDVNAFLTYFAPILDWIEKDNEKTSEMIGWDPLYDPVCV